MLDLLQFILSGSWPFIGTTFLILLVWIMPIRILAGAYERKGRPIVMGDDVKAKLAAGESEGK